MSVPNCPECGQPLRKEDVPGPDWPETIYICDDCMLNFDEGEVKE